MFTFAVLDANTLSPSKVPVKVPAMTPAVRSEPAAPLNFKLALLANAVAPPVPSSVKPDPFRTSETAASGFVLDELILPETSSQMIETGVAFVVFRMVIFPLPMILPSPNVRNWPPALTKGGVALVPNGRPFTLQNPAPAFVQLTFKK